MVDLENIQSRNLTHLSPCTLVLTAMLVAGELAFQPVATMRVLKGCPNDPVIG